MIATGVLAVSAVLVNTATGRESYAPPLTATAPFNIGATGRRGDTAVEVTPARPGANQIRISVTTSAGQPYRPQQIHALLALPARHFGPLTIPLVPSGPGRYWGGTVTLTSSGRWLLQITVLVDAVDESTVSIQVPVR